MYALLQLDRVLANPEAAVKVKTGDTVVDCMEHGDGPVDATYRALSSITGTKSTLRKFEVKSITGGTDALGEVFVTVEEEGKSVRGHGSDTNIIVAAAKAYLNALNKLVIKKKT